MESVRSANVDISKFLKLDKSKPIATNLVCKCPDILLKMLEKGVHTNITFNAIGGSVKAHKSVLACVSSVFLAMFQHDMREQFIPDMIIDALQLFLLLLYINNEDEDIDKDKDESEDEDDDEDASSQWMPLLTAAIDFHFPEFQKAVHEYQVESRLGSVLLSALARNLTPENCWCHYDLSLMARPTVYSSRAVSVCFNYMVGHYHEVIKSSCFFEQMRCNTERVHQVIMHAASTGARQVALSKFERRKRLRTQ